MGTRDRQSEAASGGPEAMAAVEPREAVLALVRAGAMDEAAALAEQLAGKLTGQREVAGVLLTQLAALLNLNRLPRAAAVIDRIWAVLRGSDADPVQVAELHTLAADLAYRQDAVDRCVSELVRGARALQDAPDGAPAMRAWVITATVYSYVGFHRQAQAALDRAGQMAGFGTGADRRVALKPEVPLRRALLLDQQGDAPGALLALARMAERLGPRDVTVIGRPYLGYAIARRLLLDAACGAAPGRPAGSADPAVRTARELLDGGVPDLPEIDELRRLGAAIVAVLEQRPRDALALLAEARVTHSRLGLAEVPRLRVLAYTALGDYPAALAAQGEVTAALARTANRLRDLFVDGVTTRVDYDELARANARYADQALTDPLTGMPNRRHLERYVGELLEHGGSGAIAVVDVDRFKAVNTAHGHLAGDSVLRRVAAILTRTLRAADFAARFGGDEFVVVMPGLDPDAGHALADRLAAAVASHNWDQVAPGHRITVTVGLSRLQPGTSFDQAFGRADQAMLDTKPRRPHRRRARSERER